MNSAAKHPDKAPKSQESEQSDKDGSLHASVGGNSFEFANPVPPPDWSAARKVASHSDIVEMVEAWKDDLDNLLVFIGLFSAVVTAFAVLSIPWLQQDPSDTSSQLLERISLQLSSMSQGNPSPQSTVPPLTVQSVNDSFAPTSVQVNVNILWLISLTLSILCALFTIVVQQWVRHLRPPPDQADRTAMLLFQLRYESMQKWRVPNIVSTLPALVQVALLLFLVGLLILLLSLDHTVVVPYIIVVGLGLLLFSASTGMPLFNIHCAYKSDSTLFAVCNAAVRSVVYTVAVAVMLQYNMLARSLYHARENFVFHASRTSQKAFAQRIDAQLRRFSAWAERFQGQTPTDWSQFWTVRELRTAEYNDALEVRAFSGALLDMPPKEFDKNLKSVHAFPVYARTTGGLVSVVRRLGFDGVHDVVRTPRIQWSPSTSILRWVPLNLHNLTRFRVGYPSRRGDTGGTRQFMGDPVLYRRATHSVSTQDARFLLETLPDDLSKSWTLDDPHATATLVLLQRAVAGQSVTAQLRLRYRDTLWQLYCAPGLSFARHFTYAPVLANLVFVDCVKAKYDIEQSLDAQFAVSRAMDCLPSGGWDGLLSTAEVEMALTCSAIALYAFSCHPQTEEINQLVPRLTSFCSAHQTSLVDLVGEPRGVLGDCPFVLVQDTIQSAMASMRQIVPLAIVETAPLQNLAVDLMGIYTRSEHLEAMAPTVSAMVQDFTEIVPQAAHPIYEGRPAYEAYPAYEAHPIYQASPDLDVHSVHPPHPIFETHFAPSSPPVHSPRLVHSPGPVFNTQDVRHTSMPQHRMSTVPSQVFPSSPVNDAFVSRPSTRYIDRHIRNDRRNE